MLVIIHFRIYFVIWPSAKASGSVLSLHVSYFTRWLISDYYRLSTVT